MRLILIASNSGYIFGDTADLPLHTFEGEEFPVSQDRIVEPDDAAWAARWIDEAVVQSFGRQYEFVGHDPRDGSDGYHVYRADADGPGAVPVVEDGQDQDTIEAVVRNCKYLGFVRTKEGDGDWPSA